MTSEINKNCFLEGNLMLIFLNGMKKEKNRRRQRKRNIFERERG
jgi:hypothetical protein